MLAKETCVIGTEKNIVYDSLCHVIDIKNNIGPEIEPWDQMQFEKNCFLYLPKMI